MRYEYQILPNQIRRWNRTAIDCYRIGCNCQICPIYEMYFKKQHEKCRMKGAVIEMVRRFGLPDELKGSKGIIENE